MSSQAGQQMLKLSQNVSDKKLPGPSVAPGSGHNHQLFAILVERNLLCYLVKSGQLHQATYL